MSDNLQTIIISKSLARNLSEAKTFAKRHGKISNVRETGQSWRFQQRPVSDFRKEEFRTFPIPGREGVALVYGTLKRSRNPDQRYLPFTDGVEHDRAVIEWDYFLEEKKKIKKAKSARDLRKVINDMENRDVKSTLVTDFFKSEIANRARDLGLAKTSKNISEDEKVFNKIKKGLINNPAKKKPSKKKSSKKSSAKTKHIKLVSPKEMPDPGPCSWLGSVVEWSWQIPHGDTAKNIDENGNAIWDPKGEWMFLWSPKYKAIVSVRRPRNMYRLAQVSRYGGAAKMFEVFADRPAENTFEIDIPAVPLKKIGKKAQHIVYRSDKWSPKRLDSDYIHDLGKDVNLFCGPSLENPEVFLCCGGKLTLTKRGLVW